MEKQMVTKTKITWGTYDLEGKLSTLIERLQKLKDDIGDVEISIKLYEDYDSIELDMNFNEQRLETDAEFAVRQKIEDQRKVWRKQQYEQLKKEFE